VRFTHGATSFDQAVENTKALVRAAEAAGVRRLVHVSIANADPASHLPYYKCKGLLEQFIREANLSHAIVCPTVIYSVEDVLINNIAWVLRRLPVFGVFGDGEYRLQPIHVEDLAELAVSEGHQAGNRTIDAVGPETLTYRQLVGEIARAIGVRRPILSVPPWLGYATAWALGVALRDVLLTRDEIEGLMQGLLCTSSPPVGRTRLTQWARRNAAELGRHYATELGRRRDRERAYRELR
jgi:NADH dehydrogenase